MLQGQGLAGNTFTWYIVSLIKRRAEDHAVASIAEPATIHWECPMSRTAEPTEQARQILALLPVLRQWVTARVQQAGADSDLSLRQYAALQGIREGACSPGELARLWHVTPAVLTGVVDRLERRGLVRREPDPDDRRRLRLALTPDGLKASQRIERALTDDLAAPLATASAAELAELGRALDLLQRTFLRLRQQTPRPAPRTGEALPGWEADDAADEVPPSRGSAPATLAGVRN
jgi:DNA-binding MarR family transcriptional regulator